MTSPWRDITVWRRVHSALLPIFPWPLLPVYWSDPRVVLAKKVYLRLLERYSAAKTTTVGKQKWHFLRTHNVLPSIPACWTYSISNVRRSLVIQLRPLVIIRYLLCYHLFSWIRNGLRLHEKILPRSPTSFPPRNHPVQKTPKAYGRPTILQSLRVPL